MSSPLIVIARLTAKPDHAEALGKSLRQLIAPTLQEPGSIGYTLHRDNDNPAVWILYDAWASRAALDAHFQQPYMQELLVRAPEILTKEVEMAFATVVGH
jgi:quinol monooxygenase YgiN